MLLLAFFMRKSWERLKVHNCHGSRQNQVENQQNNIRATSSGRCSNVIFLTFNGNLLAGMVG